MNASLLRTGMRNVVALVLGGGRGARLYPLTKFRSKPAVPVGGKYRLIDIPLSNCINSGLNRIYVLTQFNSVSLHRHIRSTYNFDTFDGGFVEILAAQQTNTRADWYQGTADAVRQNLRYIEQPGIDKVLILSGDQLYRMDFQEMVQTHEKSGADVTIAAVPVHSHQASGLGIMRLDDYGPGDRFPGEAADRAGVGPGADRSGLDRRPRHPQPRPRLPGQHGHLSFRPRHVGRRARRRPTIAISARRSSRPRSAPAACRSFVRRLLGGHRHHQVVFRGQPGVGRQGPVVCGRLGRLRRSTPAPVSFPPPAWMAPRFAAVW